MKSPTQAKVSTLNFIIALVLSLLVFGLIAYFAISGFLSDPAETTEDPENIVESNDNPDESVVLTPEEVEKIDGNSFSVLVAGYSLDLSALDAMIVIDVNKEEQKVTFHPINPNTKVYVGHADGLGNLEVRVGDLIKYKDMQYVVDKLRATTGLKIKNYITFTAEGFIEAFDKFNEHGDYTYVVPKDMDHIYVEVEEKEEVPDEVVTEGDEASEDDLTKYNFTFKKGDKLTSGLDIYNMLRYKGDSESERMTRMTTFAKDVLLKIIPAQFKEVNIEKIISTAEALIELVENIETNVSAKTFITETFGLIAKIPEFSFGSTSKYTKGIANFK